MRISDWSSDVCSSDLALATAGLALPAVELGITGSIVILGVLIAAAVRLQLALSGGLIGLLAAFHGHAHGSELSGEALTFGIGFACATALLHLVGIGLGQIGRAHV